MIRRKALILYILALVGLLSGAGAQAQQIVRLTLDKAIEIALSDNPTIKIANLEIERQDWVLKETKGGLLPTLDVTGSYTRSIVKSEMGKGMSFDPDNMVNATANLNLPLFAPSVYKTLRMNQEQMRAAVEAARGSRIVLVNEVKKAYYNVLLAERSLEVLRASETNLAHTVNEIQNKYDNELASEYDLITAQVRLSNLKPTILQTENSINVAKKLLKMYLSFPEEVEIEIQGDFVDLTNELTLGYIPTQDVSNNSDIRSLDIQINVLQEQLKLQKTARMPYISAFANLQIYGRDPLNMSDLFSAESQGEPFAGTMNWEGEDGSKGSWTGRDMWQSSLMPPPSSSSFLWTNPFAVGVQISIPIFSGFTNTRKEKQIQNSIGQLQHQRGYLEDGVNVDLDNAINEILTSAAMVNANALTIEQAQKGYDISKTRYNAGMGTMLELNSAELQLTQAKLNHTQAIYDYLSAQADYDKIIGNEE